MKSLQQKDAAALPRFHRWKPDRTWGAHARSTGEPCQALAMDTNGRRRLGGGLSKEPKTSEGRARVTSTARPGSLPTAGARNGDEP